MIKRIFFAASILAAVPMHSAYAQSADNYAFCDRPPQMDPPQESGFSMEDFLEDYSFAMTDWYDLCRRSEEAIVVTSIGKVDVTDPKNPQFIQALNQGYSAAYAEALSKIVGVKARSDKGGIFQDQTGSEGDAIFEPMKQKCMKESRSRYNKELRRLEKNAEDGESFLGVLKNKLKNSGEDNGEIEVKSAQQILDEFKSKEFVNVCRQDGDTFTQTDRQATAISGYMKGVSVHATVWDGGSELGMIAVHTISNEKAAALLKAQSYGGRIDDRALIKTRTMVRNKIKAMKDQGAVYDLNGTRALVLDQGKGETVIIGLGVAQTDIPRGGGMGANAKDSMKKKMARDAAFKNMAAYATMTVNDSSTTDQIKTSKMVYEVECNVTKNVCERPALVPGTEAMGVIFNRSLSAQFDLDSVGVQDAYETSIVDEESGVKYYVNVVAWSPSIMAKTIGGFSNKEAAGRDAVRQAQQPSYNNANSNSAPQQQGIRVRTFDW